MSSLVFDVKVYSVVEVYKEQLQKSFKNLRISVDFLKAFNWSQTTSELSEEDKIKLEALSARFARLTDLFMTKYLRAKNKN